jgi:TP901 family phage tail tape measure protein
LTTIASLVVNLGMNSAKFNAGTKSARSSLRGLAEGTVALNAAMGVAGVVIATAGKALSAFTDGSKAIDDQGKLADRLGFTTENLTALHHAASLAGVESEALNNSLQKMNVNLAKAAQGGEAAKVFERLGLNAKELIKLDPMTALGQMADAINRLPTPAEKSAAAVALFGKSGGPLLTLLKDGSKGLAAMREEADTRLTSRLRAHHHKELSQ